MPEPTRSIHRPKVRRRPLLVASVEPDTKALVRECAEREGINLSRAAEVLIRRGAGRGPNP